MTGDVRGLLAAAEGLGLDDDTLAAVVASWRDGDCATTRRRLADAVSARLAVVEAAVAERQRDMAAAGPGTARWADVTASSLSLFEDAARLQAVAGALAANAPAGPCDETCGCTDTLAAGPVTYHFPSAAGSAVICDLAADGGDMAGRVGEWQQVLARVRRRDPLPGGDGDGVVLRFPSDADLAATLGRLVVAEYRCCSFGSYAIVVDGDGLRLEIRMPAEAAGTLAAVIGRPDPAAA